MLRRRRVARVVVSMLLVLALAGTLALGVAAEEPLYHTIRWGESLLTIGRMYGVTVRQLVEANGLSNANLIYAGQRLLIPTPAQGYVEHVVAWGESLLTIAARYGVRVWEIAARNGITNQNLIYVGQRLVIPGGEGAMLEPAPSVAAAPAEAQGAIIIASPLEDAEIGTPVTVTGWGSGFENNLVVIVLDEAGMVLGQGYVIVDAESGKYGPFTGTIEFTAPASAQMGRIQVFSVSPRDGAIERLSSVAVRLLS